MIIYEAQLFVVLTPPLKHDFLQFVGIELRVVKVAKVVEGL
jgi:hypothetical protein